ncbi:MAG: hypothetical protein QM681_18275 [Novosphingobium sp.]
MTTTPEDVRSTMILTLCNLPRKRLGLPLIAALDGLPDHHWRDQRKQVDAILNSLASEGWQLVRGEAEVSYEVWEDDMLVASSTDEADGRHYHAVYSQGGLVKLVKAETFRTDIEGTTHDQ